MKRFFGLGLICLVLTLVLISCTPKEYGEISIVSPGVGSVVREPYDGTTSASASLWLKSTFGTEKNVEIYVTSASGTQGPWYCLVPAGSKTQCPGIPLVAPGNYRVTVNASLIYGGANTVSADFSWNPYSNLDRVISTFGVSSASWGYFVFYLISLATTAFLAFRFTKDLAKVFVAESVFTVLVIPISLVMPSAGIASWMSCYLLPLAIVFFAVAMQMFQHPRPPMVIIRPNGTGLAYQSFQHMAPTKQIIIKSTEINIDLDVSERKNNE